MLSRIRAGATPATVIAAIALFFAIATGGAMAKQLITGADIADGTVTSADVATNTIAGVDVDESSLTGVGSALKAPVEAHSLRSDFNDVAADQTTGSATVTCPAGRTVLGGGGRVEDPSQADIVASGPFDASGSPDLRSWSITVRRRSGVPGSIAVSAYAICAKATGDTL